MTGSAVLLTVQQNQSHIPKHFMQWCGAKSITRGVQLRTKAENGLTPGAVADATFIAVIFVVNSVYKLKSNGSQYSL